MNLISQKAIQELKVTDNTSVILIDWFNQYGFDQYITI